MTVLVIGGGPSGLATAACLRERGVPYRIVDHRGTAGGAYLRIRDELMLASPTVFTRLPGLEPLTDAEYLTVKDYRAYLAAYVAHHALTVERAEVTAIAKRDEGFLVTLGGVEVAAKHVVVATGMWDFPRRPPIENEGDVPAIHAREWRGPAAHPEARVAVVGGATSAVEIAEELGRAGRKPIVAARSGVKLVRQKFLGRDLQHWVKGLERIPTALLRSRCEEQPTLPATDLGFAKMRAAGEIDVRPALTRVDGKVARFADDSTAEIDLVVYATGYRYDTPFLPAEVERAKAGHLRTRRGESVSWRSLFVVGAPCAARISSEFLRGVWRDAVDVADEIARRER